jgi:hypothetical protein
VVDVIAVVSLVVALVVVGYRRYNHRPNAVSQESYNPLPGSELRNAVNTIIHATNDEQKDVINNWMLVEWFLIRHAHRSFILTIPPLSDSSFVYIFFLFFSFVFPAVLRACCSVFLLRWSKLARSIFGVIDCCKFWCVGLPPPVDEHVNTSCIYACLPQLGRGRISHHCASIQRQAARQTP